MRLYIKVWILIGLFAALASCATTGNSGLTSPSGVIVKVHNYSVQGTIGIATEVYFSVANVTDRELKNLTLTVTTNPPGGVNLPFTEMPIGSIGPNGTWSPPQPFMVTGRLAGRVTVFFTVTQDGKFLATDYAIVSVGNDIIGDAHRIIFRDIL